MRNQEDAWTRFGSSRLAHHIHVLRRAGWPVLIEELTVTTSDAGRTAVIGEYCVTPEIIRLAGAAGQDFAAECLRIERERRAA